MNQYHALLTRLRKYYWYHCKKHQMMDSIHDAQEASDTIYQYLSSPEPCMIARFGGTELKSLMNYLSIHNHRHEILNYITCKTHAWWWTDEVINDMQNLSGFFPSTPDTLTRFDEMFLKDIDQVDVLGSWLEDEIQLVDRLQNVKKVHLPLLEPFWAKNPWSRALEGKKVLVVHPFSQAIKSQYEMKRELLFDDPNVLPPFQLDVITAVQSLGGENSNGFKNWFEAFQWMKDEIDRREYDICIIGCGAYGFSLAAHVKRSGKKAIHLAGATQLLFGIKGKRWEDPNYGVKVWNLPTGAYARFFNEHWIRPGNIGKPKNANDVENGCYW